MFALIKLIQSLFGALHSEGTPGQLAAGIVLGSFLGLTPLTNFNSTVVLGSLVFAGLFAVPLFFATRLAVIRYRATIGERVRQSRWYRAVMASKVYNVYKMFRP